MKNLLLLFLVLISCSKKIEHKNDLQKLHDIDDEVTQIIENVYNYYEDGTKELWFIKTYKFNELGNTSLITDKWQVNDEATYTTTFKYDNEDRIIKETTTKNNKKYGEIKYTYNKNKVYSVDTRGDTLYEKRTKVLDENKNIVFEQIFDAKNDFLNKSEFSYDKNNIKIKEKKYYQVINKNYATCCLLYIDNLNFKYDKNNFLISDGYKNPTIWKYPVLDKKNNWTTKKTYFNKDSKTPTGAIERKIIYKN
jgi:YD repeat-containing protein